MCYTNLRAVTFSLIVALSVFCSGRAPAAELFKLSDLTADQRATLFKQIDAYGLLTAMLNFCQRPPNMVEKLLPIAQGCVDGPSITAVVNKYNAAVVAEGGRWDCSNNGLRTMIPKYEEKISAVISDFKTACHLRSFYKFSFPEINRP